ncbi:MAG: VWA domain-containing protein [Ruminococcaceae bacterium]|nr:VWA domain-containing protein [Oscillospiraceae bacterium]
MKQLKRTKLLNVLLCGTMLLSLIPVIAQPTEVKAAKAATTMPNNSKGSGIIVSLGDSYSAGEGVEEFYDQKLTLSKKVESQDWLSHRSTKSWPGLLTLDGKTQMKNNRYDEDDNPNGTWYFSAVSGAQTVHLEQRQKKEYLKFTGLSSYISGSEYIDSQLSIFDEIKGKAEYVTMTMGGNDADFSAVVEEAVTSYFSPNYLVRKLNTVWDEYYYGLPDGKDFEKDSIRTRLYNAYHKIQEKAGTQAKIIIAGYPKLLNENGRGLLFNRKTASLINDAVVRFNDEIQMLVNSCKTEGMKICFVSVEQAFNGMGAGSFPSAINGVMITQPEDIKEGAVFIEGKSVKVENAISAYSIHPNELGTGLYAACVQEKIEDIETYGDAYEWPDISGSEERDIVLVLDAAGSMAGTPMQETKDAALKFTETVLKEDASIGIVAYDDRAMRLSNFNKSKDYLSNIIQNINDGGSTNIDAGLQEAEKMLDASSAKKKIIVLMSDGAPNRDRTGDDLIAYADELKAKGILLYTLGFFHSTGNNSAEQKLMQALASDGCHFEVDDADQLIFFFEDIAEQIKGTNYTYIRIACPVNVIVRHNNEVLSSIDAETSQRTSFGTLTFEENEKENETSSDNRIKILRLKEGAEYDILIHGNGVGMMNYTISFSDGEGGYNDTRRFYNIPIRHATVVETSAVKDDTTTLEVDTDGDGSVDTVYEAETNGYAKIVETPYVLYICLGVGAVLLVVILVLVLKAKKKKRLATAPANPPDHQ